MLDSKQLAKTQPIFTTGQFIYDTVSRELSAEASSLGDMFGNAFQVKSERTGKIVTFVSGTAHRNVDGDVTHWEYLPACPAETPRVKRIIIFND